MTALPSPYDPPKFPARSPHDPSVGHLLASARSTLEQAPPPSLREILTAYRTRGDGDRDMLLALLNAKTAEDQRLSSVVSLHRTMLEIHQSSPPPELHHPNASYHYPPPPAPYTQFPPAEIHRPSSHRYHRRVSSRSRSPPTTERHKLAEESTLKRSSERPSKRHRLSPSPHPSQYAVYESSRPSERYPLSPYSSSERSNSAEYSPRSRSSMTIGSLLSTRPTRETPENVSREGD